MKVNRINLGLGVLALGLVALLIVQNFDLGVRKLQYWCFGSVTIDGLTLYLNPEDKVITPGIVKCGIWEPAETSLIRGQIEPGDTFIDVGANIGYYTVIASEMVGPSGRVFAFEPDPASFAFLQKNVEANGCTNVVLEQKALSNQPGSIKLYLDDENKGAHKIYEFGGNHDFVEVEAVRLDDYLKELEVDVDLIKIDTEGAEGVILEGMRETLGRNEDVRLVVEFFPKLLAAFGYSAKDVLAGIQSLGFEFHDVEKPTGEIVPITAAELLAAHPADRFSYTNIFIQRPFPNMVESENVRR